MNASRIINAYDYLSRKGLDRMKKKDLIVLILSLISDIKKIGDKVK